ncbi:MAG: hypothetical protein JRM89_03940 [Nitrososphaerota archaeon]|jgi:hypothetical protein|nr:hypothetical protein [Nitrososphaerota archaeon]MDG6956749.1 hypothetical protein [Nitrososphaerota archaeon]MDG6959397.1 hypothetical protein [Nitrososphaerota archaeon]MDG6961600.1 hypothetical protein [Nitrososphaerota archaeon]MDG6976968.1 hypothetical protein [Nitrososphaerota archaeon]
MSDDYVAGEKRSQSILFPETLDEYVTEENPVRFVDAFVDRLDLEKLVLVVLSSAMAFFWWGNVSSFVDLLRTCNNCKVNH